MDARLDSALAKSLEPVSPTPFSPFVALLPEELCWLIDRTFAAEARVLRFPVSRQ